MTFFTLRFRNTRGYRDVFPVSAHVVSTFTIENHTSKVTIVMTAVNSIHSQGSRILSRIPSYRALKSLALYNFPFLSFRLGNFCGIYSYMYFSEHLFLEVSVTNPSFDQSGDRLSQRRRTPLDSAVFSEELRCHSIPTKLFRVGPLYVHTALLFNT